jgi:branched-chain amino acid transport system ATP-binding protein
MLSVTNLQVGYGDIQVVWDLSFEVEEGAVVALLGSNGAGKTTTLLALMGILPLLGGAVHYRGVSLKGQSTHQIVNMGIGMVPESQGIFTTLSVLENLELGAFPARARSQRSETLAEIYGIFPRLAERKAQIAGTLSGGERRMLAIGRALMAKPDLLILDEPSLGLAPIIVEELFRVIQEINEAGVTILLVEQNVSMTLDIASHAYVIENGVIVSQGSSESLRRDRAIQEAYLGL